MSYFPRPPFSPATRTPEVRDRHIAKMRELLGMPPSQFAAPSATSATAPADPVCTCDGLGECDVCRAWAARMLELSRERSAP